MNVVLFANRIEHCIIIPQCHCGTLTFVNLGRSRFQGSNLAPSR